MDKGMITGKRLVTGGDVILFDPQTPLQQQRGKFSVVYQGRSLRDDRKVLVKKLRNAGEADLSRYEALATLRHPALQRVIGTAADGVDRYVVMRYSEGEDLKAYLRSKGRLREREVIPLVKDLLAGLHYLHAQGWIHTDIKPSNILLFKRAKRRDQRLHARLLDPGEAVSLTGPRPAKKPFAMIYSPPEQVLGAVDLICEASDLYSLGVVMWEMLTGEPPYRAAHPASLINLQLNLPLKKKRHIPVRMMPVIRKATAKEPFPQPPARYSREERREMLLAGIRKRYRNAREMLEEMEGIG